MDTLSAYLLLSRRKPWRADGKWKLVMKYKGDWELYDMDADRRTELHNLAAAEPERMKRMASQRDGWAARTDGDPWKVPFVTIGRGGQTLNAASASAS